MRARDAVSIRSRAPALVAATAALLSASSADAHEVGLSRGDYMADGAAVRAELTFARKEIASLVAGLDVDRDGTLTEAELLASRDAIQGALVGRVKVVGDGAPCPGELDRVDLAEQDGVVVRASYRCAKRPTEARVTLALLDDLPFGHRHLARAIQADGPLDLVLSQRVPSFSFKPPYAPAAPQQAGVAKLARLGATHVATAWTLPAFLLALLVRCEARRAAVFVSIAFACSLLLGLVASAMGAFTPSPRAIAIAIAVSLVYAGADGLVARADRESAHRDRADRAFAWTAFAFGFAHGLGCAAAFRVAVEPATGAHMIGAFAIGALLIVAALSAALVPVAHRARARGSIVSVAVLALGIAAAIRAYFGS